MNKDKTHKLILIMFSWYQHIAGTSFPVLEQNNQPTQHLNSVCITDFIRLLKKFNVQLKLSKKNSRKHQRQNDRFIMDDIHKYTSSITTLKLLNACRFYLQITFLSDIANLAGDKIIQGTTTGQKQDLPTSKLRWPTQRKPNKTTWQVWRSALLTMYCNNGLSLKHEKKLHKWISNIHSIQ